VDAIKSFSERYTYIIDEGVFYDRPKRKSVDADLMRKRARIALGIAAPEKNILDLLQSIRNLGVPRSEIKAAGRSKRAEAIKDRQEEQAESLAQAYLNLKPRLGILRYASATTPLLYKLAPSGELEFVGGSDEETFKNTIASEPALVDLFKSEYMEADVGAFDLQHFITKIYKQFEFDTDKVLREPPPALSWDASRPAFKVMSRTALREGAHPTWDEFLARCTFPETIKAYIWSIFEPSNFGRQALWLQGEGGDGKSTVLRVLADFMGTKHTLVIGIGTYDSDFFFGSAYGKRLALYPDCKNLSVLRKERIKSLVGKDVVHINAKYEKPFSAQIYSKLIVGSNWMPQINFNDDSERTRLLICTVKSYADEFGDQSFEPNLRTELPSFLLTCEKAYQEQCPKGMNLIVPPSMREIIKSQCAALDGVLLQKFIADCLNFGPKLQTDKATMFSSLKAYFMKFYAGSETHFAFNDLTRLLGKHGVTALEGAGSATFLGVQVKPEANNTNK